MGTSRLIVLLGLPIKWHTTDTSMNTITISCLLVLTTNGLLSLSMECSDKQWSCQDGRRCIELGRVCDREIHCGDGSDERYSLCTEWKCPDGFFKCADNQCIKEEMVCNSFPNCNDETDEYLSCFHWNCSKGYFKCDDGQCLNIQGVCNGKVGTECTDWSDELHCDSWTCPEGMWQCTEKFQCILSDFVCNMNSDAYAGDCFDKTDEDPVMCANWTCPHDMWRCRDNSKCIRVCFSILIQVVCGGGGGLDH